MMKIPKQEKLWVKLIIITVPTHYKHSHNKDISHNKENYK